jgi:cholestenol delta-isomerase
METVTAVCWGPLSFLCAAAIIEEHPIRHALQIIISLGQLYGDVLYYGTVYYDAVQHGGVFCRPEGYYFWAYFMQMNAFWIVIPIYLVWQSALEITRVFKVVQSSKAKTT